MDSGLNLSISSKHSPTPWKILHISEAAEVGRLSKGKPNKSSVMENKDWIEVLNFEKWNVPHTPGRSVK